MKLKVQWNPQKTGGAKNMAHLLQKAAGHEWTQPKRDAVWPAIGKAIGTCAGPLEFTFYHCVFQILDMELQDLMFAVLGFGLVLV